MAFARSKKEFRVTEGPLLRKVILFVLPLLASNFLQMLYNAADMMVVGLSTEADAVGAIGVTGPFVNMIINIFIGFSVGANVMVARFLGARDHDAVNRTVHTSIAMSLVFGLLGGVVGFFVSRSVLALLGNTGRLLDLATLYTQIYFCGVPFLSLTNYCISIFRAKGDTRTPLLVLSFSGVLNVVLNLFFVLGCGLSVEGVALATAISNAASAVVLLVLLARDSGPCRFCVRRLGFDRRAFRGILYIGLPAGIQGALFSLSNMQIQSSIIRVNNQLCPPGSAFQAVVKGNAAATNLEGFAYTATNAVHQAAVTFTSQNMGAGKPERVKRVMGATYLVAAVLSVVFTVLLAVFYRPLIGLYGVHGGTALDQIALETAYKRLYWLLCPYITLALLEIGSGVVRGLGKSLTATFVTLVGACLFRVVWILTVFEHFGTLESIYISYPISWLLTGIFHFAVAVITVQKAKKRQQA